MVTGAEKGGVALPDLEVWAVVERYDDALYVLLDPMRTSHWPNFLFPCGAGYKGVQVEDVIDAAIDAYAAAYAAHTEH